MNFMVSGTENGLENSIPKIKEREGNEKKYSQKSVPEIREQAVLLTQEHYDGDVMLTADQ